ncbi:MAG: DUF2934 domain-containing protein [Verrucomicrobiota bacterium]
MAIETNRIIREQAYLLWEAAGQPADLDLEFWLEAERQVKQSLATLKLSAKSAKTTKPRIDRKK